MSLRYEIARNNIIIVIGGILSACVGFFSSIFLARLLGPEEFGLYSFTLTVVSFFIVFTFVITGSSITRFASNYFSKKEYGKINTFLRFLAKYQITFSILTGSILIVFPSQISYFIFNKPMTSLIIQLSGIIVIFNSISEFLTAFLSGVKNFKYVSAINVFNKTFLFLFPVLFVFSGFGHIGAINGVIISSIIISISLIILVFRKYGFILNSKRKAIDKKRIIKFGVWSFVAGVSATIFLIVDSFMISILLPIAELGFYRIAVTWSSVLITITPISGVVMYTYFSRRQSSDILNKTFSNSMKYSLVLILPLSFLLSSFSGNIINMFYGIQYTESISVLQILSFVSISIVLGTIFNGYFSGIGRPDLVTKIIFLALTINIILNYILISNFGIVGAAAATLISRALEVSIYISTAVFITKLTFKISYLIKPLISSIIVYFISLHFLIKSILELFIYGTISIVIYLSIMFVIGGINRKDVKSVFGSIGINV